MTKPRPPSRNAPASPTPPPLEPPQFPNKNLLLCTWALFTLIALWRLFLALHVLLQPSLATGMGAVVINWRRLDQFTAWFALLLLVLGSPPAPTGQLRRRRISRLLTLLFSIGIALTALSIFWDEFNFPDAAAAPIAWAADITLALAALAIAGKHLTILFSALRAGNTPNPADAAGLTLLDLWRFAASQWALYMVASMLALRAMLPKNGLLENEQVRGLLFQLPAIAILPQAMMIAGISWWSDITRASQLASAPSTPAPPLRPRVRAWVVALIAINLAALLMVLRQQWLGVPGSVVGVFAIIMYLAGFPSQIWRSPGGKTLLLAWALLALAWIFLLVERTLFLTNQPVSTAYYGGAWRHLWATGALVLWFFAMGALALNFLPPPLQPRRPLQLASALLFAGALITSALLFLTALQQGESQVPFLRALPLGILPELAALLIAAAVFLRTIKILSK